MKIRGQAHQTFLSVITAVLGPFLMVWLGLTVALIVYEQIAMLPPRPPTPAQVAAATPRALADWSVVRGRLSRRIRHHAPLELGKVWATRAGRICGLVNMREAGVDSMQPFYSMGLVPILRSDDERLYFREWMHCVGDHQVELHPGSEQQGFCGSPRGRGSVLGQLLCGP